MPSLLDLCEKYYNTRDAYELLGIPKTALVKDGKPKPNTHTTKPHSNSILHPTSSQ